jgi:TolB-like protein/tetratricopeptide (TPR) repeat protein
LADVFISYAHTSRTQAQAAAAALRGAGYSVWHDDDLAVHREFTQAIEEQLAAAKAVLVIWSANAAKSAWVLSEANRAREERKLVQLSIDKTRLPMPFDQVQCADLASWTGEGEHPNWRRVVASIGELVQGKVGAPSSTPRTPSRTREPAGEPLLAVLAFDNLSGDPEVAYFSDGVSEEIQQSVSRGSDLKVIGRTSSFRYRGADKAVRRVAAELSATHVLDGAVRRSGEKVRISAQLIECAQETTLWSDRFDGELDDVFTLQERIAASVAAALKVVFAPAARAVSIDPVAYELFLKGMELASGRVMEPEASKAGIELLEQATRLAPNFARAWTELVWGLVNGLRAHGADEPYETVKAKMIRATEVALALDPRSSAPLALAHLEPAGAYADFEATSDRALASAPNDPDAIQVAALFRHAVGRTREAAALSRQAFELDPMSLLVANSYAATLGSLGRYAEARPLWDRLLGIWPDAVVLYANALLDAGRLEDWDRVEDLARLGSERGLRDNLRESVRYVRNLRTKDPEYAQSYVRFAYEQLDRTSNVRELDIAHLCALGRGDEAFALVERASFDFVTDPSKRRPGAGTAAAILSPARSIELIRDPRFPQLCAKLKLCDYWVQTDRWPDLAVDGVTPYDFKAECRRLAHRP